MATLSLPAPDDTEHLKNIGHNFLKVGYDEYGDIMWNEGRTFRLLDFKDLDFDTQDDDSQSTVRRWYEQHSAADNLQNTGNAVDIKGSSQYYNPISGENEERSTNIITPQEANKKYGLDGRLNFDRDITIAEAQILHERKAHEMWFQQQYSQAEGFWKRLYGIGSMGAAAMADPVNVALLFNWEPVFTKLGFLGRSLKTAGQVADFVRETGSITNKARAWRGFKQAALFTTATEIPIYAQKSHEQADYSVADSLLNIAIGSGFGSGLHVVGGKTADWLQGISAKRHAAALDLAYKQALADKDINVKAVLAAVKDIARKKNAPNAKLLDDIDAAKLQRVYNEKIGYNPPLLEYKPVQADEGPTIGERTNEIIDFEELPGSPLLEEEFNITSGKLGSNEGNTVTHKATGEKWYFKKPENKEWAVNEIIASVIMRRLLGDAAPQTRPILGQDGKFVGVASKWKEGQPLTMEAVKKIIENNPKAYQEFVESAMVHAWLGNRDFAAPGNLIIDRSGRIHFIDAGGSMKFRAMGEIKKDWVLDAIPEIESFLTGVNPDIKQHLDTMNLQMLENAFRKIYQMSDEEIEGIIIDAIDGAGTSLSKKQAEDVQELVFALINRRDQLAEYDLKVALMGKENQIPKNIKETILDMETPVDIGKMADVEFQTLKNNKVKYKKIYTRKKAMEYINAQINKLQKNLTDGEKEALKKWAAGSYHSWIIKYVNGQPLHKTEKKIVEDLLSAISKVKTNDNIVIHVGKKGANFAGLQDLPFGPTAPQHGPKLVGQIFTTDSVFNGTLNYHIGKQWAMQQVSNNVKMKIFVPKGTNMTFVDKAYKSASEGYKEAEIIMGPKTQLKIRSANFIDDLWYIDAEVVNRSPIKQMEYTDILKESLAYSKNKHGPVTSDVTLAPEIKALNTRERLQKIESDTDSAELRAVNEEIEALTEELQVYKKDSINEDIRVIKEETDAQVKKSKTLIDAAKAVLNCVIGKV